MEIIRQTDKDAAAAEAGEYLNLALLDNKKKPVLLVLSAGSSFSILDYIGANALGENVSICLLDERFSSDAEVNSFMQLQKTDFYTDALNADCSFFGTVPRPGETKEEMAGRWETFLKTWRSEHPDGIIIATLGMGADGHTGGVLPYPEDENEFKKLFQSDAWVRAYNAGDKNKYKERCTTTLTFLKNIDVAFGFVCGQDKKINFDKMLSKQGKINELPALAWHELKNVKVFTDIKD